MGIITFSLSGGLCIARCPVARGQPLKPSQAGPQSHPRMWKLQDWFCSNLSSLPCPHLAHRMTAHICRIKRLSDAPRLGSLKNKSSCVGFSPLICRSLSFHPYLFLSLASSVKLLYVSPPLGLCATLVGATVLNKSEQLDLNSWSALTLSGHARTFTDTHETER